MKGKGRTSNPIQGSLLAIVAGMIQKWVLAIVAGMIQKGFDLLNYKVKPVYYL